MSGKSNDLKGLKVAFLCTDGFEQAELLDPRRALDELGATTAVVSPKSGSVQGMEHKDLGRKVAVDFELDDVDASEFDALVLPGGVANPDELRINKSAVDFIRGFVTSGKPIAAICHGPWTLIEADAVRGKRMTSWPSLKSDLNNAGAKWTDEKVVVDQELVTSRKPADLPDFNREMIALFKSKMGANTVSTKSV